MDNKDLTAYEKEERRNKGVHSFWRRGIMDLDVSRQRVAPSSKVLERGENEQKKNYMEKCTAMRRDFTPLVYVVDGIFRKDARGADKRLSSHLDKKWRREYSEMVGFVQARMSLSVVRSNTLLLRGERINEGLMGCRPVWECKASLRLAGVWRW